MSWTCPYEVNGNSKRLKKTCKPGIEGCILGKSVKFIYLDDKEGLKGKHNVKVKSNN